MPPSESVRFVFREQGHTVLVSCIEREVLKEADVYLRELSLQKHS